MCVLQVGRNTCFPACAVMIERWRGAEIEDPDARQRTLFERMDLNGLCTIEGAASVLGGSSGIVNIDDADALERFAYELCLDRRAVICCWGDLFGEVLARRGLRSPNGELTSRFPLHAVVASAFRESRFELLDPWTGQRLDLSREEFAQVWTGHRLICER